MHPRSHTGFRHQPSFSLSLEGGAPCIASPSLSSLTLLSLFPPKLGEAIHTYVRVYVTYLCSCRLSLSSTPVTVTNDALSIRIVRREGENGEHLLAPYPSWHQPYELLRFLRHPFRRHPPFRPLRCDSRYSINWCQWERDHLQLFFTMPYSKCMKAKDDR